MKEHWIKNKISKLVHCENIKDREVRREEYIKRANTVTRKINAELRRQQSLLDSHMQIFICDAVLEEFK